MLPVVFCSIAAAAAAAVAGGSAVVAAAAAERSVSTPQEAHREAAEEREAARVARVAEVKYHESAPSGTRWNPRLVSATPAVAAADVAL